jgi:NDP-sugar pyrophosphorylase family protein
MSKIKRAFVLAAGLGTRLRPLTDQLPKPLVPVGRKALITFAFDHLIAEAGVEELIVNTHHLPAAYRNAFPEGEYRGRPLHFRHEPVLLDTGGGIRNIADLLDGDPGTLIVYNGDILTDLPLGPAIAHHRASGNEVTLVLRSAGGPKHIAWDSVTGRIADIRNRLESGRPHEFAFACIYLVEPAFIERIPPGIPISVIPIFLDMIRTGAALGGIVIDEGDWRDLGSVAEYLRVHRDLRAGPGKSFPAYGAPDPEWRNWIDPTARIAMSARLVGAVVAGAGARIGEGALVENSILWPEAEIASHSEVSDCIVRTLQLASGKVAGQIF